MTTNTEQLLSEALIALEHHVAQTRPIELTSNVIFAIREHLTQPAQAGEAVLWAVQVDGKFHGHFCATSRAGAEGLRDSLKYQTAPQDLKPMAVVPLYTTPPASQEQAAQAWDEGYHQGVADERTSEANIGVAGFGAKVEPARQNPYRTTSSASQEQAQQPSESLGDVMQERFDILHMVMPEDPREAVSKLINAETRIALDPAVSSEAEALIQRGRDEQQPSGGEVVGYRVSVPGEPELGHWFSEDPLLEGYKVEPLCIATKPEPMTWQPIETAPENTGGLVVVRWLDSDGAVCNDLDHTEDGCWARWHDHAEHVEVIGGHGVSYTPPYQQWALLPDAPGITSTSTKEPQR